MSAEAHHTFITIQPKQHTTELRQVSVTHIKQQIRLMISIDRLVKENSKSFSCPLVKILYFRQQVYVGSLSPVQSAADRCPADLTQVACCQTNQATFLVANDDAIPTGQTAVGQTLLWHCAAALETMEVNPFGLHGDWATELHIPHTAPILLTGNTRP